MRTYIYSEFEEVSTLKDLYSEFEVGFTLAGLGNFIFLR